MGRYSLDREGLVYAHEGNNGFADLVAEGAYKSFPADSDGILPLMDEEWFDDDVTSRVKEFIRTVWGEEYLRENLDFIAEVLKPKKGESALETIRRYLSTQFWKDHLKCIKSVQSTGYSAPVKRKRLSAWCICIAITMPRCRECVPNMWCRCWRVIRPILIA